MDQGFQDWRILNSQVLETWSTSYVPRSNLHFKCQVYKMISLQDEPNGPLLG